MIFFPIVQATLVLANVWAYMTWGHPINLATSVFCGLMFFMSLAIAMDE